MAESPRLIDLQQRFEDNPRRYFASLANEYRKAGDLERAISICRIYLDKQPEHMAGHVVLGQALHAKGDMEAADEIFKIVLQLDPENLIALKCIGDIAEKRGNLQLAHENFRHVLTADPRDHDTNNRLKAVEKELKLAASRNEEWIPPRTSDEFLVPPGGPSTHVPAQVSNDDADATELSEPAAVEDPASNFEFFNEVSAAAPYLGEATREEDPHHTVESHEVPHLEMPLVHEDVSEDDFNTLLPEPALSHRPTIAEPVEQESAEESLAVPDLMEESGEISPASIEEYQYRTAEFRLPVPDAGGRESSLASGEVESEAKELLEDVEIPPPAPVSWEHHFDQPMRTGEYSLSDRDLGEPAPPANEDEPAENFAPVEPAGPFITETVAELYLQQGFTGEALLVYRQLARAKPNDQRIADRIASLEQRLADEHVTRQAAFDSAQAEPLAEHPDPDAREFGRAKEATIPAPVEAQSPEPLSPPGMDEFDAAWGEPQLPPAPTEDDWFAVPDVAPVRSRQTVHEFFAVLGRAKPELRPRPSRGRVSSDDIRAAADITAGFGAFGIEPKHAPPQMPGPVSVNSDMQDDVRRFRTWLDGLSDS